MVAADKTNGSVVSSTPHLEEFESFVACLERLYNCSLSRPQLESPKQIKKFCTGLIEGEKDHLWRADLCGLSAQSRFGIAHSLFLFRKTLPGEKPQVDAYVRKLCTPQEAPDDDFMDFALKLTRKLFRHGWDRTYMDHALTNVLSHSSSSESGRKAGGGRGLDVQSREQRSEFTTYVLNSVAPRPRGVSRVQAIDTGGKWRIISIPPRVDNALRPLHKAMYSHLSRMDWLLRGDAKAARFKDFSPVEGEIFVSGDYESATDNLNAVLQKAILSELLARSSTIPQGIVEHALSIYSSRLGYDGTNELFVQQRGQLMGQLTSFPLLCLVNYITFRYSIRRPVPVRINGDDIVFRATPAEVSRWERNVAKGGLTLSKGKTLVHPRAFTLNSTPFWSHRSGGARLVGFVRSSALFPKGALSEQIESLNGRFYSACSGYGRQRRSVVRTEFLRRNQKAIHASRRSITRGLGMVAGEQEIRDSGLWFRELFYLEQVEEPFIPTLDERIPVQGWRQVPKSWVEPSSIRDWEQRWSAACVYHAWFSDFTKSSFSEDTKMSKIREGCSPYGLGSLIATRVRRMLHMTRSQIWKWVNLRRNTSVFGRVRPAKSQMIWVETDTLPKRSVYSLVKGTI
nr:MAG: RNA-dependent RNA polymerase [Botourmiaviridae sp.]